MCKQRVSGEKFENHWMRMVEKGRKKKNSITIRSFVRSEEGSVSKRNSCVPPPPGLFWEICLYSVYLKELSCGGGFREGNGEGR